MKPILLRSLLLAVLLALAACRAVPARIDAEASAEAGPVAPPPQAVIYAIDAAASQLRIYVFRGGRAAALGHNHVLQAPKLRGEAWLVGDDPARAGFALQLRLDELEIDPPALRAATGGAFAGERSASDIAGTQRNLLKSLNAAQYPEVTVRATAIRGDWPVLVADIAVSLHGQTRNERVALQVTREADALHARGRFVIRQSDYGVAPFSVLGGLMAVQDNVVIDFDLHARRMTPP